MAPQLPLRLWCVSLACASTSHAAPILAKTAIAAGGACALPFCNLLLLVFDVPCRLSSVRRRQRATAAGR
jgi:hypothetical protein